MPLTIYKYSCGHWVSMLHHTLSKPAYRKARYALAYLNLFIAWNGILQNCPQLKVPKMLWKVFWIFKSVFESPLNITTICILMRLDKRIKTNHHYNIATWWIWNGERRENTLYLCLLVIYSAEQPRIRRPMWARSENKTNLLKSLFLWFFDKHKYNIK